MTEWYSCRLGKIHGRDEWPKIKIARLLSSLESRLSEPRCAWETLYIPISDVMPMWRAATCGLVSMRSANHVRASWRVMGALTRVKWMECEGRYQGAQVRQDDCALLVAAARHWASRTWPPMAARAHSQALPRWETCSAPRLPRCTMQRVRVCGANHKREISTGWKC